jgi:hypothetical protein
MSNNILRAGSALVMSLALTGCLTTGGGEPAPVASADQPAPASQVQELVRCERPLGSAAVLEPDANVMASLQAVGLQSPTPVIRMMMMQSNCFRVIGDSLAQPGQRPTVKWLIAPAVALTDTSASDGGFIGNLAGNILPRNVGLGDVSVRTKEAQTSLLLTDAATGEQKAAAPGVGRSSDLGATAAFFSRRGNVVNVAAYADTPEGKVVSASFIDSYNKLVAQVRGFAPPPAPAAKRAKTARAAPPPADQ